MIHSADLCCLFYILSCFTSTEYRMKHSKVTVSMSGEVFREPMEFDLDPTAEEEGSLLDVDMGIAIEMGVSFIFGLSLNSLTLSITSCGASGLYGKPS